eukprot:scaffold3434_cov59-Phaeocystis_antarctica.AAC.3
MAEGDGAGPSLTRTGGSHSKRFIQLTNLLYTHRALHTQPTESKPVCSVCGGPQLRQGLMGQLCHRLLVGAAVNADSEVADCRRKLGPRCARPFLVRPAFYDRA